LLPDAPGLLLLGSKRSSLDEKIGQGIAELDGTGCVKPFDQGVSVGLAISEKPIYKKKTGKRRFFYLVGGARFELATNGLKVRCSTN
jgi:hypothetical protein